MRTAPLPTRASAVTAAALAVGTAMALRTTQEQSILGNHDRLLVEIMVWWLAWAVAVAGLRRTAPGTGLRLVLVGVVALRVVAITPVVPLSDDLYRYAWDGAVQASGTSPYRFPPSDPALAGLRTDWLFPDDARCARQGSPPDCTIINRPDVRTIYPPVAQLWFLAGHWLGASQLRDLGWQLVSLVADLATVLLLWRVLLARGRDPRWVAVYAWSPVAVLEAVQNGHVDSLATCFVVGAVALAGRRPALSGAALGLATMVKLYPVLLLPVLLGRRPVRVVTAFAAVCVVSYLPHVLALGRDVLGYLPGYLAEEDYGSGDRFLLLSPLGLRGDRATAVAAAVGLVVALEVVRRVRRPDGAAGAGGPGEGGPDHAAAAVLLLGAALLVATPIQPWYGLPLAALAALAGRAAWLAVPAAAYPTFFAVVPAGPSEAAERVGSLAFAAALVVVVVAGAWRRNARRPGQRVLAGPSTGAD